jgi:3-polyprenyl-4-hydroxybenzoate decarboxylase
MRLVVALTGASGQIVGIRLIERLISRGIEVLRCSIEGGKADDESRN